MTNGTVKQFLKTYIIPLLIIFLTILIIFSLTITKIETPENIINILNILIQTIIAVLAIMIGIIFIIIQYNAQQYSPRNISKIVLFSIDTLFMISLYLIMICIGFIFIANINVNLDNDNLIIYLNIYSALSISIIILDFFYFKRITELMEPDIIINEFYKATLKNQDEFVCDITNSYLENKIDYPRNIPISKDILIPFINAIEMSFTKNDLATITVGLDKFNKLIKEFYDKKITNNQAVAISQYFGLHITRIFEKVETYNEDDVYDDIFRINLNLIKENSDRNFYEAFKWSMITYYYLCTFIKNNESDYPLRCAIIHIEKMLELNNIYKKKQLDLFLNLVNYISEIVKGEDVFQEPMEKYLKGMKTKRGSVKRIYELCAKNVSNLDDSTIVTYLYNIIERVVMTNNDLINKEISSLSNIIFKNKDNEHRVQLIMQLRKKVRNKNGNENKYYEEIFQKI